MADIGFRNWNCFYLATLFVFLILARISNQATDDGILPNLTINIADVELLEKEDARIQLGTGPVVTCEDADGDPVRAYIESIFPTSGCGLTCLQLEPSENDSSDFNLMFQPTESFGTTPSYTMTIACTDDLESAVTNQMAVTIVTNSPPVFIPDTPPFASTDVNGLRTRHDLNYKLYKVETNDPDGDAVFYTMSTNPITEYIEMEYASGQIRASQNLRLLCETKVVASVIANDPNNPAVGPFTVDLNINNNNVRPRITNLDTTVTVDEDVPIGHTVLNFDVRDGKLNDFTYNQLSLTSPGMEAYGVDTNALVTLSELNYERDDQRSAKLYLMVNDGFCQSETYTLDVEINDVPEAPVLSSLEMLIEADEGQINEPHNIFILDEDFNEVHIFSRAGGSAAEFDVDPNSGNIFSVDPVLLGRNQISKVFRVNMRVTDKDGLRSSVYRARVRVWDINDKRPYFTVDPVPFPIAADECMDPGTLLGRVTGRDDDSRYRQNNWIYFGGGGAKFALSADGGIYLTQQCLEGEVYSGMATIADLGITPGPLTGDSIDVLFTCGPCPPPNDGTGGGGGDGDGSGNGNGTSGDGSGSSLFSQPAGLAWFVPAVLGAVAWLALTALFFYWYCPPCSCKRPCASKPKPTRVTPEPPKPTQPNPPKSQRPPLAPPPKAKPPQPPPPPAPAPYPPPTAKPTAIENMPVAEQNLPPANLRLGPPGTYNNAPRHLAGTGSYPLAPAAPPQQAPKGKSCAIL
ncbi:protocadherin fat 4 [Plakobranchus ocellatus]|uniref:Protocadherin fat 4 n=1 Tax=Plakobranchus ocellatus TaxID=259542 RepID=A0AAV4AGX6_9GAST|nr:protocadherin fat 4 [Plakobranchus ocellatus]